MNTLKLVVEGVSEEQIQRDIINNTKGWRLFFKEPIDAKYHFMQPFWGYSWNGTGENLKDIILKGATVDGHLKCHICIFKHDGEDMFAWCSWTKELYDFNTGIKHKLEGNHLASKITNPIFNILGEDTRNII